MSKLLRTNEDIKQVLQLIYDTKDEDGLWMFIKDVLGVEIPRAKVCEDHDAPFDFVRDIFFQRVKNAIAVANRTGGKTSNIAIIDTLNWYFWNNCEIATIGAIEQQAFKCYQYVQDWVTNKHVINENLSNSLMSKTEGHNGSVVQILTGTMSGVNSPHPHKASLDEIELMAWNILMESMSMSKSEGDIIGQTILTSSRKFAFGPMERMLKEADTRGFKVYKWCVMETIAKHDPEVCKNSVFNEDCQGRCEQCSGYLHLDDVISIKRSLDPDTWTSQWRSQRPMLTALIYPQFNERVHVVSNKPDLGKKLKLSEDFGFAEGHADVVGFFQDFAGKRKLIDEIWVEGKQDDEIIDMVEDKIIEMGFIPDRYKNLPRNNHDLKRLLNQSVEIWYCPPEEPSKIAIRQSRGYRVVYQEDAKMRRVNNGISLVRKALADRDSNGEPMLQIDPKCSGTLGELSVYSNKIRSDGTILDEPAKVNDNGPDMLRYYYINESPIESTPVFSRLSSVNKSDTMVGDMRSQQF